MTLRQVVLDIVEKAAAALGDDLPNVVLVGGVVPFLYPVKVPLEIRPTQNIECITGMALPDYYRLVERLKHRGFKPSREQGAPICRLVLMDTVSVDVMPTDPGVLGFSNRWYPEGLKKAIVFKSKKDLAVKALAPVFFLATKLEAFHGRGHGDFQQSHDLEDCVALLASQPDLLQEIAAGTEEVHLYLCDELNRLIASTAFMDAVPGCFIGDAQGQQTAAQLIRKLITFLGRFDAVEKV